MSDVASGQAGVLFDLDGTLVDTNYLHVLAWWRAFADAGIDMPMATLHRHIGMGSARLVEELLGRPDEAIKEGHGRHFTPLKSQVKALPGGEALVREVAGRGGKVVLATSAKEEDLDALLRPIGGSEVFDLIVSSKDVEQSKPDPEVFQKALERSALDPSRAIAVGDTVWDVEAARRIGVRCVCLASGGIGRQELEAAGAEAVYEDPADLLRHLDASPLGELLSARAA